jgi:lipoprotein-releasing system ATP-binding protein
MLYAMNDESAQVLAARKLCKTFTEGERSLQVLKDLDLDIRSAERVAIVGASGSGKTTLLQLLGGLDTPSSGDVLIGGESIADMSDVERGRLRNRALGFVYQFHHLLPEFTALENVAMPLLVRGDSAAQAQASAGEVLSRLGLVDRLTHKPAQLSGGERQRTAIARALVTAQMQY